MKYCSEEQLECEYFGRCVHCSKDNNCSNRKGSHVNCFVCVIKDRSNNNELPCKKTE